ncbi:uncharacterized membrane-anchored protein YjiN (DUF445 family) [Novosphingobium fluoreni]|uniref:Uncharacterized membrane-anchored protein YjiN (DUF445 family) n=3 Tax=Novosphingobium TaxID=165696 RepID=A0A7W6FYC8_9SPHN|nr:uncharacterized membrane-anchored protein YjiN (DUF445 family) [Novosphingobium fluoreni]
MSANTNRTGPSPDRARVMRRTATGLLLLMAAAFVALQLLRGSHPAWGYAIAFTEAAMVGGLADWFAVTALFRHPLGLPIPHTAIIPTNKDRIADTMAVFLKDNFLTPQVVARRLVGFNLAAAAGTFLADPDRSGQSRLRAGAANLLADVLESLDPERLGTQVRAGLVHQLEKIELSPLLGQMLSAAIADRRHLPLLEGAIRWAGNALEANEDLVRAMIRERANSLLRFAGLDTRLANAVLDGLYKLLAEMVVQPDHPLKLKIETMMEELAHNLVHDPATRLKVERAKLDLLANPAVSEWWQSVWERLRRSLIEAARNPDTALGTRITGMLGELGQALRQDPALQLQINRFARRTLVGVVSRYGDEIVRIVSETVKRWDAHTVTARIEGAVGRDLQFIRINGTLVGGLFGLAIHAVERFL